MLSATGTEWHDVDAESSLLIKNVKLDSAGTYTCEAKNEYDKSTEKFTLRVTGTYIFFTIKNKTK